MRQRCFDFIENIAIHLRHFADDLESNLLAERARKISHQPRESANAIGKRTHPAGQRFPIEPMRKIGRAPHEQFQFSLSVCQKLSAGQRFLLRFAQVNRRRFIEAALGERGLQMLERLCQVGLMPFEPQQ